jgi:hypothetical protein
MTMSQHPITPADHAAQAIVDLINVSPRSPTKQEIAAIISKISSPCPHSIAEPGHTELGRKIREAIARVDEAQRLCFSFDDDNEAANHQRDEREAELSALEAQIPNPPRSFWDIVARAQIAYLGADKECDDERIMVAHSDDCFEGPAVRFIEAVLQFAEVRHA